MPLLALILNCLQVSKESRWVKLVKCVRFLFGRKWEVRGLRRREMLMRAYIQLEIYTRVTNEWVQVVLAPTFFMIGGAVVLFLYVPLAHSELLPGLLNAGLAYLAAMTAAVLIWASTDCLEVTRDSEAVISSLNSKPISSRLPFIALRQAELLKRAKALRPVAHPVGSFGNITISVPVVFVEEILNQLLLLLSL